MNWLDFAILAVVAWLTLTAYLHGLIRETIGLGAVVVAIFLAGTLQERLATNLNHLIADETVAGIAAFLMIFAVIGSAGWVLAFFLRRTTELLFLGWADHAGGAVFGFLKAVLIVQALTVIFVLQPALGLDQAIADSVIGSFFLETTPVVRALLPSAFDRALTDFFR